MRLLAILHGLGINPALVAGLVLMPAVVAMGYLAGHDPVAAPLVGSLRGSIDDMAQASRAASPDRPF